MNAVFDSLTPREQEIAELVGHGLGYRAIARATGISQRTVEWHVYAAVQKLPIDWAPELSPYRRLQRFAVEIITVIQTHPRSFTDTATRTGPPYCPTS